MTASVHSQPSQKSLKAPPSVHLEQVAKVPATCTSGDKQRQPQRHATQSQAAQQQQPQQSRQNGASSPLSCSEIDVSASSRPTDLPLPPPSQVAIEVSDGINDAEEEDDENSDKTSTSPTIAQGDDMDCYQEAQAAAPQVLPAQLGGQLNGTQLSPPASQPLPINLNYQHPAASSYAQAINFQYNAPAAVNGQPVFVAPLAHQFAAAAAAANRIYYSPDIYHHQSATNQPAAFYTAHHHQQQQVIDTTSNNKTTDLQQHHHNPPPRLLQPTKTVYFIPPQQVQQLRYQHQRLQVDNQNLGANKPPQQVPPFAEPSQFYDFTQAASHHQHHHYPPQACPQQFFYQPPVAMPTGVPLHMAPGLMQPVSPLIGARPLHESVGEQSAALPVVLPQRSIRSGCTSLKHRGQAQGASCRGKPTCSGSGSGHSDDSVDRQQRCNNGNSTTGGCGAGENGVRNSGAAQQAADGVPRQSTRRECSESATTTTEPVAAASAEKQPIAEASPQQSRPSDGADKMSYRKLDEHSESGKATAPTPSGCSSAVSPATECCCCCCCRCCCDCCSCTGNGGTVSGGAINTCGSFSYNNKSKSSANTEDAAGTGDSGTDNPLSIAPQLWQKSRVEVVSGPPSSQPLFLAPPTSTSSSMCADAVRSSPLLLEPILTTNSIHQSPSTGDLGHLYSILNSPHQTAAAAAAASQLRSHQMTYHHVQNQNQLYHHNHQHHHQPQPQIAISNMNLQPPNGVFGGAQHYQAFQWNLNACHQQQMLNSTPYHLPYASMQTSHHQPHHPNEGLAYEHQVRAIDHHSNHGAQAPVVGFSQLKLGYNLVSLLPIDSQPTRTRQAYGMDKVWHDEFELLFPQFVSNIVWVLIEVETNPSIRDVDSIIGYKGRYIVRVGKPACGQEGEYLDDPCNSVTGGGGGSEQAISDSAGEGSHSSEWEDHETTTLEFDGNVDHHRHINSNEDQQSGNSGYDTKKSVDYETCNNSLSCGDKSSDPDAITTTTQTSGSGQNCEPESDCDSGAMVNSTSGSSDAFTSDSSPSEKSGANQTPPNSPPSSVESTSHLTGGLHNSITFKQSNGGGPAQATRKFPTRFRMFIDSAKVRFCCDTCGHGWTSMKGRVVFWYELFELVDDGDGGSNLIGYCAYKLFGQQCDICKIENRFERPMWYPEEVTKVLGNLYNKIGQIYFGFRMPTIDKQRRAGKPKTSHNSTLCQACHDGVCTDRK